MTLHAPAADARGPRSFLARCLRGTEWILAAEIETRFDPDTLTLAHRSIRFTTRATPTLDALRLATADDVFLVVGTVEGIYRTRESLTRLREGAHELPWAPTIADLTRLRPGAVWTGTTLSTSSLGKRNYNRYEIEASVAEGAAVGLGLPLRPSRTPRPADLELSIRVHLEGTQATIAARIFDTPLHRRDYKLHTCAGTLHPPLAAAMAMVAGLRPGSRLLDPFTGVGTIPIEAQRLQPHATATGSDIDPDRVRHAASHARRAGASVQLARADAARLPWPTGTFTHVVSNVPWHRTVALRGHLAHAPHERDRAIARALDASGRAVLLVHPEDPIAADGGSMHGMTPLHRSWLSTFGQHPRLCILSREGDEGNGAIDTGAPWGPALARWLDRADTVEPQRQDAPLDGC